MRPFIVRPMTADVDTSGAGANLQALVADLPFCVTCNAQTILTLAIERADELVTFDGQRVVRPGDDEDRVALVDFGTPAVLHDLDTGKLGVREFGEQAFLCEAEGPREGRWGHWLVVLAALGRSLEQRFGHPPHNHGPLH
jgi:hypothetical protein